MHENFDIDEQMNKSVSGQMDEPRDWPWGATDPEGSRAQAGARSVVRISRDHIGCAVRLRSPGSSAQASHTVVKGFKWTPRCGLLF